MFAPPDLPVTTTHPRDELTMPEDAPARRRKATTVGMGRRPPANADPHRPPANAHDRRRRERMGVRVGGDEAQEEVDEFARYEEEGDAGDQPHPAGDGGPQPFPPAAFLGSFFHATLDARTLDEVFDMIRAPDTVIMSQAVSYRTGRDHRLDPSSSAFVASPHPPHGIGYTVSDFAHTLAQYGTPPAYYDFLSGPNPTTTQDKTVAQ
ncbi:hypothetical protein PIB30_077108 [Stylosanthes scabra]|uniref:Uncharacterized protein n=1 Tax=Stylosanthes scabra TaxID=79078 RepID=A0ABU6RR72_9FABA|nr:hypothetical protein [Stylosanthes scabra]